MMIGELDEVNFDLEVDGEQVRRQLARNVWESKGWATVACVYQERGSDGAWKRQAALTLSGPDAVALASWLGSVAELSACP